MPHLLDKKNVDMLTGLGVFSEAELKSRCEIMLENYCKSVSIEASTMVQMVKTQIIPAVQAYSMDIAKAVKTKMAIDEAAVSEYEKQLVKTTAIYIDRMDEGVSALEAAIRGIGLCGDIIEESAYIRDNVLPSMSELRVACDEAELITAKNYWPFPTYGELLFGVR